MEDERTEPGEMQQVRRAYDASQSLQGLWLIQQKRNHSSGLITTEEANKSGRMSVHGYLPDFNAKGDVHFLQKCTSPFDAFAYISAISINVSFLISVFSRLVISASAVSMAVSTFTPVSMALRRMTKPSFARSAPWGGVSMTRSIL